MRHHFPSVTSYFCRFWSACLVGCTGFLAYGLAVEIEPMPPMPLDSRPILTVGDADADEVGDVDEQTLHSTSQSLRQLQITRDRIGQLLRNNAIEDFDDVASRRLVRQAENASTQLSRVTGEPDGAPRQASTMNLSVQFRHDAAAMVTASLNDIRLGVVLREFADLLGRGLEDDLLPDGRQIVSWHCRDMPWQLALDLLLAQVGAGFREAEDGRLLVMDYPRLQLSSDEIRQRAANDFDAAAGDRSGASAAEALVQLAELDRKAERFFVALNSYLEVIESFGEDPAAAPWVRMALRGYGQTLIDLNQASDARRVFRDYIDSAPKNDPELPQVYLLAAKTTATYGREENDSGAIDQAIQHYQTILQHWSDDPEYELAVAEARTSLGRLLFAEGNYLAARRHLEQFVDHGVGSDELRSMIAESSFRLAEQAAVTDPILMAEERQRAVEHFTILLERFRSQQIDGSVEIYRKAAFYLGASYLLDPGSDPVKALVAFLRARQMFPENRLEPDLVLAIARCYAQLEEDSHLIEELYHVLNVGEQMTNGEEAVAALMGSLKGDLVAYDDSVRAQVLFYIAQAHYRAAQRRPEAREDHLNKAVRDYRRVLVEAKTPNLSVAARLGLGRASLALNDEQQGIAVLEEVLASDKVHPRDSGLAARWLGDYYLEQEQFDAAALVFARGVELAQQAGVGDGRGAP